MKFLQKKFLFLLIAISLVILGTYNSSLLFQKVYANQGSSGSSVGGVDVEGLKKSEMIQKVSDAVRNWKSQDVIVANGEMEMKLSPELFEFDVQSSVEQFLKQTDHAWYAFWESKPQVNIPLILTANPELKKQLESQPIFQVDKTYALVVQKASLLQTSPIEGVLSDLSVYDSERVSFQIEEIAVASAGLPQLINVLNEQLIVPGKEFSFLQQVEEAEGYLSEEILDFVASVLYRTVLGTDFELIERHQQLTVPKYLAPGFEAKVNKALKKDLKFVNQSKVPAKLKVAYEGNSLKVEITSLPGTNKADVRVGDNTEVKPRVITRYSDKLRAGSEKLVQEGKSGLRVNIYRTVNGSEEKLVSNDYYPPTHRIIEKSAKFSDSSSSPVSPDQSMDLDGNGLPDLPPKTEGSTPGPSTNVNGQLIDLNDEKTFPEGSYFDKGGNLVIPTETKS